MEICYLSTLHLITNAASRFLLANIQMGLIKSRCSLFHQ